MKIDYTGQVALVTGGRRGIGAAIARELLGAGAEVIITATKQQEDKVVEQEFGPRASCWVVDFSDAESTKLFLEKVSKLERLDVLINNAGLAQHKNLLEATAQEWDLTHDVNLRAPFLLTQTASKVMQRQNYGRIVNIGSVLAHIGRVDKGAYTAAKTGLIGLTRVAAVELASSGIIVNQVSPGMVATELLKKSYTKEQLIRFSEDTPMCRVGEPEEIAKAVAFLGSTQNSFMTGQAIVVDGGMSVV
jgi:3-oxoacyl-[acyl-carrier protein] reductase